MTKKKKNTVFEVPPYFVYGIRFASGSEYWGVELERFDVWQVNRDWSSSEERFGFVQEWRDALEELGLDAEAISGPTFWRRQLTNTYGDPERID